MRKMMFLLVTIGLLAAATTVRAEAEWDGGLKLWYAEPKVADRALMYGAAGRVELDDHFWVRGFYLYGDYDFVRSSEPRRVQDFGLHDAELIAGMHHDIFHFGFGARWMAVLIEEDLGDQSRVRRPNAFGPALVAGATQSFAEWPWGFEGSPWGWYAEATWMFYDVESDDGDHINFAAGVTHVSHGIHKSLGYRFKETFDHERMEGFTAKLLFAF